jgi:transcriptional/translational regulatory protein YebC/TACO1
MEAAIARGLGTSATGAVLENMIFEVIMPPSVAMIVDVATDNRNRANQDVKLLVKTYGGTVSPTNYLFEKKGRVVFEKDERNLGMAEVLDDAIEAGAQDVELDEDENIVVWTEPSETMSTATALQEKLDLKVQSSDVIWDANEDTKVSIPSEEAAKSLSKFMEALRENPNVQGVYANVGRGTISDEAWEDIQGLLDA